MIEIRGATVKRYEVVIGEEDKALTTTFFAIRQEWT
jgi:hypothetical protein